MSAGSGANRKLTDENDALNALLSGDMGGLEIDTVFSSKDMQTEHAPDAIDFEDEDELADDELPEEEPHTGSLPLNGDEEDWMNDVADSHPANTENDEQFDQLFGDNVSHDFGDHSGFYDNEQDSHRPKLSGAAAKRLQEEEDREQQKFQEDMLKLYYPTFKKHAILDMNSIFGPKPKDYEFHTPYHIKPLIPTKISLEVETDERRIFRSTLEHNPTENKRIIQIDEDTLEDKTTKKKLRSESDYDLVLATFEWDYDAIVGDSENTTTQQISSSSKNNQVQFINSIEDYEDDAIFEGNLSTKLELDLNDPHLLFTDEKERTKIKQTHPIIPTTEKLLLSKFNISNDNNYDLLKENYHSKIRSTIGNLNVEHSMPAVRLQSPYYKVKLTKEQLRNFHKQTFKVRPGQIIQFSKLKTRKKKRDRGKEIRELFNKSTDLTLADTGQTILIEHSEQSPIVIPNFGMGSKLINYYRKKNEEDISRPKLSVGETHVLGVQDKSPFWNFGFVEPGNIVPTIYNKLVRAPVFKHDAKQTDFLMVKSSGGGISQRYYLKNINHLFVAGQLFPVVDIPGPHSRKVTTASKNRLKVIVYRVLQRNPEQRLLVKDISQHFPDQNDMQNRQRLKEFMEYQRSGDDQGFWKLKEDLPSDRLITPEDLTLLEAMQVGQQQMEDKEFYTKEELNEEFTLWNLTKNFINATQGKAMLQIHGDNDGKAFSFAKTSMKGGFKSFESNGHSYNVALQQKAYDEEISRTWYDQQRKLTTSTPLTTRIDETNEIKQKEEPEKVKYLKITRMIRDRNGILQRKYEIIKDPELIRAYIKRRERLEEDIIPEDVKVTNDEEKNAKNKRILEEKLAKLEKNQERRNARKLHKENQANKGIGKGKSTSRRCATCGAIGHIRTNKSCPMYDEGNP